MVRRRNLYGIIDGPLVPEWELVSRHSRVHSVSLRN